MAVARPFAFNPSSVIPGTEQVGDIAVGASPQNYSGGYGGVRWWNGPDEDLGYIICYSVPTQDHPSPDGPIAGVGFFRSQFKTESSFITIAQIVSSGQTFTNGVEAKTWLNANGYWTSYDNVSVTPTPTLTPTNTVTPTPSTTPSSTNLLVYLDSGNPSSYSGTGDTWFDLEGASNNATLFNSPTYSSSYQGILQFDDVSQEYATIPDLGNLAQWTVEAWFRLSSPLTGKVTSIVSNQFDLTDKLNFSIGTNNQPTNANLSVGFYDGLWRTTTGVVPQVGVWYQVVGTYDGSVIRQYINGVASGGTVNYVGTPESGGEVRLMRRWDLTATSTNLTDGDLAIVKIYNSTLSAGDVLSNYNSTYTRFLDITPTPTVSPTPTLTPEPTTTPTPTLTPTPSSTPSVALTGYSYNLQCSPAQMQNGDVFLFSSAGNITYNPNDILPNGIVAFNTIDTDGIDRTSYYSPITGDTTLTLFQGSNVAVFNVSEGAFTYQTQPGANLFYFDGSVTPGLVTQTTLSSGSFTCGEPIFISINSTPTATPTPTPTPSAEENLINPIITENDEYIEVGDDEYLMF